LLGTPRTDPGVPDSGTGLLPWMIGHNKVILFIVSDPCLTRV